MNIIFIYGTRTQEKMCYTREKWRSGIWNEIQCLCHVKMYDRSIRYLSLNSPTEKELKREGEYCGEGEDEKEEQVLRIYSQGKTL